MTTTEAHGAFLQLAIHGDLTIADPAFVRERAFVDAISRREVAFAKWFGPWAQTAWPELRIAQCGMNAIDRVVYDPASVRFLARDGALEVSGAMDVRGLEAVASTARADAVWRGGLTLLAYALTKRKRDGDAILAYRDQVVPDASLDAYTVPAPATDTEPKTKGRKRDESALAFDIGDLLPFARVFLRKGKSMRFHFAYCADDDKGRASLIDVGGEVGEPADVRVRALRRGESEKAALTAVIEPAWQAGFRPIDESDWQTLSLEYPVKGMGTAADLAFRHLLEDELGDALIARGLGYVDGGDIGSGTMAVHAEVVDVKRAIAAIKAWLTEQGHPQPARFDSDD
jgi:hypothetical protein